MPAYQRDKNNERVYRILVFRARIRGDKDMDVEIRSAALKSRTVLHKNGVNGSILNVFTTK